ncbi:MAG: (d)CMP kinase [Myxococcota bacterium]
MPGSKFIVALDGPAGAGKSTVSRKLAERLDFALVDTGAIYRCIALAATRRGVDLSDDAHLKDLVEHARVRFQMQGGVNHVFLDDEDVTDAIRTPANSMAASTVSARPVVRAGLLQLQRRLAMEAPQRGAVLEGRDIGTVVFPDAEVKVFLDATVEERARRRHKELSQKGTPPPLEQILQEIIQRDLQDSQRAAAPLKKAEDAYWVDSTQFPVEHIVDQVATLVEQAMGTKKP